MLHRVKFHMLFTFLAIMQIQKSFSCVNPFAGCDGAFNATPFNGTLKKGQKTIIPSPAKQINDNTLALLEAGVSDEPWACNTSTWGGRVWNRCRAPDIPICTILPMILNPSPSESGKRMNSVAPSPSKQRACRTSVALSTIVDGWCKEGGVCEVTCETDLSSRRVFDFFVHTAPECPTGFLLTISPFASAMLWLMAALSMAPTLFLSSWRLIVLFLRSKLHWRSYWVGCSAFSALIFKWPIGRTIFSGFASSISLLLLSLRKFDRIENLKEESGLIGIDIFVGVAYSVSTYMWYIGVISAPLALGHRAMTLPLSSLTKNTKSGMKNKQRFGCCFKICCCCRKTKLRSNGDKIEENESSSSVIEFLDGEGGNKEQIMDDDTILRRLGMKKKYVEKTKFIQKIKRSTRKDEIRKHEAIQDIKAPMKPSDRHSCSHVLHQKTWQLQSLLYLLVLGLASVPCVFSIFFESRPSPVFWSLGTRAMHGGFGLVLATWWQRFSAAIPDVKRGLAANVIRPPGDPGKPTNGSKKALNAWRHRINEARSRLTPVLNRFIKIETKTRVAFTIIIFFEVILALFDEFHKYLPIIEPIRWILSSPIYFSVLYMLSPMPRRTGKSIYKTTTLIELMTLMKGQKTDKTNAQEGNTQTNQYVGDANVSLLTDNLNDTDIREAAMLRLSQEHQKLSTRCPGFNERDVRSLLLCFDTIAGKSCMLSSNDFSKLFKNISEDNRILLLRWFDLLLLNVTQETPHQQPQSKGIGFSTHAIALHDFCTASRLRLAMIVFDCYDIDGGGDLDRDEILVLLKEVNSASEEMITQDDIDKFDADRGGTVDRTEFANAAASYPGLLRPAYKLQRSLRESTLSLRRWEQISKTSTEEVLEVIELN